METRRDESKRRAITQAFVNRFTRGLGKWKEWLYRLLSALSAWRLLSNIVLPKNKYFLNSNYEVHTTFNYWEQGWTQTNPSALWDLHEHWLVNSFHSVNINQCQCDPCILFERKNQIIIISACQYMLIFAHIYKQQLQKIFRHLNFLHTLSCCNVILNG